MWHDGAQAGRKRRRVLLSADLPAKTAPTAVGEEEETARGHPPSAARPRANCRGCQRGAALSKSSERRETRHPCTLCSPPQTPGFPAPCFLHPPEPPLPSPPGHPHPEQLDGWGALGDVWGGGQSDATPHPHCRSCSPASPAMLGRGQPATAAAAAGRGEPGAGC